jgi:hypothetical protein
VVLAGIQGNRVESSAESVTKLSYGYDDVDCVVLYVCSCCYVQNGGGAVDPESLPYCGPSSATCPFDIFFMTESG